MAGNTCIVQPLFERLPSPRVIYLSLPARETVDTALDEILDFLDSGDVVMDGGNSFFRDSTRREKKMREHDVHYLDCGTSGGLEGAQHGACFMVGGPREVIDIAEPVRDLAQQRFVHQPVHLPGPSP